MSRIIAERYELDHEVGRGGMGAVWLGRDVVLGRPVALKQVGLMPGAEQADLDRVQREARVSAMLHHEHVVSVFDLVSDGDQHWLVMEYVESRTLAQIIREDGPLPPDEVAALVGQAAVALGAAHRAGIVHRDVKPSNMLVTDDGRLKLSDFGIARTSADPSLTQTGLVTGSPGYLAPEVAAGGPATTASDVWSLGATIFHAVAGHPPYDTSENLMGALYRIVHEEPPRTEAAGWLDPLLRATMHRDPEQRWSADQVAAFLRTGDTGQEDPPTAVLPVTTPTPAPHRTPAPAPAPAAAFATGGTQVADRRTRRRTLPFGLVAAAVALVAVVVLVAWLANRDPAGETADPGNGAGGETPSQTEQESPTADSEQTETSEPQEPPTEEEMTAFVESYLADVAADPGTTWGRLTPGFQEESGGFESYRGFWESIESADVQQVSADPEAMTVSYRVAYTVEGEEGRRPPEDVTLMLVQQGGDLLIDGEA